MVITIFDALGIQDYLFGSNRLAENIGASYLVEQALSCWPLEAAQEVAPGQVKPSASNTRLNGTGILDSDRYDIELVYSAGGNAVFLCKDGTVATALARAYSTKVWERAPGLTVACHHHPFEPSACSPGEALTAALRGMALAKNRRIANHVFTGSGVTERCATGTEEDAVALDPTGSGRFLGPAALAKIKNGDRARDHLKRFLGEHFLTGFDFPTELDDLGRSRGERSFIGVVHIDGNGTGREFMRLLATDGADRQRFLRKVRKFSTTVSRAGSEAIRAMMAALIANWDGQTFANTIHPAVGTDGQFFLPVRPLVYGGDDITFVADGRLALDLAAVCLRTYSRIGERHAAAGIALVKSHYPFSRAYALSEQLCRNAKVFIRENGASGSAMDWQFLDGGPQRPLSRMREREYTVGVPPQYLLTCRPYWVCPAKPRDVRDWETFRDGLLLSLQGRKQDAISRRWLGAHSRIKSLVPKLRRGPTTTGALLKEWKKKGYAMPDCFNALLSDGFAGGSTPYLDAIELLDFLVPMQT